MSALLEAWTGLVFLHPAWLLVLLLLPVGLLWRARVGHPALDLAPATLLAAGLPATWRTRCVHLPRILQVVGIVLAAVALARPVARDRLPVETQGIDIALCLDISSSMAARDMDPERSRLRVALEAARTFVEGRPHDRIALVCFARYPDLRCPLTLDHAALVDFLDAVERVDSESEEDATGIGTAVALGARLMQSSAADSKVVILLTDGEENVATTETPDEIAPVHAAQLCLELGVRAYTIAAGIGRPDDAGGWIPLDTSQIRRVAEKTGGRFFEARDANAVAGVYEEIGRLETVDFEEPRYELRERFAPFLLAAVVLLLAARLLEVSVLGVLP